MKEKTHNRLFLPAVVAMLLFIMALISFVGKGTAETPAEAAQADQCKALCDAVKDCTPGPLQAFSLADCAGYTCSKQSDCTNVTCGGNPPQELKQALGC